MRKFITAISLLAFALWLAIVPFPASSQISLPGYTTAIVFAADLGVIANTGVDMTAQMQTATNAACIDKNNRALRVPGGDIDLFDEIIIPDSCDIGGTGRAQLGINAPTLSSGTRFIQHNPSKSVFHGKNLNGSYFHDFTCLMPEDGAVLGACIHYETPNPAVNLSVIGLTIERVHSIGGYRCFWLTEAANSYINNNICWAYASDGLYSENLSSGSDSGDSTYSNNRFWSANVANSNAGIHIRGGSGLALTTNKTLGSVIGIEISACNGRSGTYIVTGNSLEESGINNFRMDNCGDGSTFGNLALSINQMQNLGTQGFNANIALALTGGGYKLDYASITGNIMNNALASPTTAAVCMEIEDGNQVIIAGNLCTNSNTPTYGGIHIVGNASNVQLSDNMIANTLGAPYLFTVQTTLIDRRSGLTLGTLPGNTEIGSMVTIKNAAPGTFPCSPGGGAVGTFVAGGWKC